MTGSIAVLTAAAATFVGAHLLLSHPARAPLVGRLGEKGFAGLYTVVALATFVATVSAYRATPDTVPLWAVGDALWAVSTLLMLVASILFLGSMIRNPAMTPGTAATAPARGVFAVTRHPMMWGFALWGVAHILIYPLVANIVLCGAIIALALVGAALQDRKKAALDPQGWPAWQSRTSYLPFAAIAARRARFGGFGLHTLAGGLVLWLAATWAHIPLAGWAAGIWRWVG
ncbi:NnrU family protein [Sphingomonas sp. PB2P19]|uniref:NnrU family protein n=1 Tax=Sphingomonas rhamnosi TaxID=3096156 RepID=UPI002FCB0E4B